MKKLLILFLLAGIAAGCASAPKMQEEDPEDYFGLSSEPPQLKKMEVASLSPAFQITQEKEKMKFARAFAKAINDAQNAYISAPENTGFAAEFDKLSLEIKDLLETTKESAVTKFYIASGLKITDSVSYSFIITRNLDYVAVSEMFGEYSFKVTVEQGNISFALDYCITGGRCEVLLQN